MNVRLPIRPSARANTSLPLMLLLMRGLATIHLFLEYKRARRLIEPFLGQAVEPQISYLLDPRSYVMEVPALTGALLEMDEVLQDLRAGAVGHGTDLG
jgi:hypothetical protein